MKNDISDNMGLSADNMQMLSYKMTHMYYNFSGTIRVPVLCQYAHKLTFEAESINRSPSAGLENQLYFLKTNDSCFKLPNILRHDFLLS